MPPPRRGNLPAIAALTACAILAAGCAGSGPAGSSGAVASPRPSASAAAPSTGASGSGTASLAPSPAITHGPLPSGVVGVAEGDPAAFFLKPNGIAIEAAGDVLV